MAEERLEYVIGVKVDQASKAQAKKELGEIGEETSVGVKHASQNFNELRDSMNQIRNLQFGDMIAKQLDKIQGHLDLAKESVTNLFSKEYWEGALESATTLKDKIEVIGVEGKEAWKSFKSAGKAALDAIHIKLIAIIGAIVAMGAAIKNAFSVAGQIKTISNEAASIGMTVTGYQEWSYVMEKTGSDADALADAIKTLSAEQVEVRKGTEDAIAKFAALGMSMETVANMSQEELFKETIKRLQNVRNEVERTSLAYRIFGEDDAAKLANVLRLTNAETAEMASTVHLLGNTISDDLLTKSMALAGAVSNMKMAWQGLSRTLAELFMPVITKIVNAITKAMVVVNLFLKTVFGLEIKPASGKTGLSGVSSGIADVGTEADKAVGAVEKLRRTTMGFDELNIVANPNSGGGADIGASGGGGGELDLGDGGMSQTESAFDKAKGKIEEFQKKVQDFMNKWKTELKLIAGLLGALAIAKLLTSLAKALGLGEKFLNIMKNVQKAIGTAIVVTVQFSAVKEFLKNFMDGEGFKNWIYAALATGLGSLILWSMWGPAGLAIGLGVTAVASLSALFEHGGIDSIESAIVALTALGTAIGAVYITITKTPVGALLAQWGISFSNFKTIATAALTTLMTTIKGWGAQVIAFVSTALTTIRGALLAAGTAIKTGFIATLTAIKTAVVTVVQFIIANPIVAITAAIVAFVVLIATKGDEIQNLLNKVSTWIKNIFVRDWREIFGTVLGTILNGFVKIAGDYLENLRKLLNGIIDFIRGVFTGNWQRAWEGVKQIFAGVFGALSSVAKAPINAVIALVNGMLAGIVSGFNAVKRALNSLSIKIPDWVPQYGGKKFGFNFSMSSAPSIPMLAKGGIVTASTIANIGENGKEAVLPLENNTGWMDTLADKIAARNGKGPTQIILTLDGRELGKATVKAINDITKTTGNLPLVLG